MLIPQSKTWEPGFRKRTIKKELTVGPVSLKFITLALLAVGALFYLAESSQGASQEYQITQLSATRQQVEEKGRDLEVEAARLKSLNEISASSQSLGLVPDNSN